MEFFKSPNVPLHEMEAGGKKRRDLIAQKNRGKRGLKIKGGRSKGVPAWQPLVL